MATFEEVCKRARELGATVERGINWTWANGFSTKELAWQFLNEFPTLEHRGVYTEQNKQDNSVFYSVRFR